MSTWSSDELKKIGTAEELLIASRRADGSLRKAVIIWVVRLGDDLYVRSVNGRGSAWFRGVETRREGLIQAGGVEKEVSFEDETEAGINKQIDAAYQAKYSRYPSSVEHINSLTARSATIKLVARA